MAPRVILVGGTGAFGERLLRALLAHSDFAVTVAVRDVARAAALLDDLRAGPPRVQVVRFDRAGADAAVLRALGGFVLVDAAGPFQGGDLRLARAAIAAGLHYVDLADARDFVAAFPALDAAARAAGVVALAGASSTPALSHAVLDGLVQGWRGIDSVEAAIAPGNRAPRGLSVIQAILSYAGQPLRVWQDDGWAMRPGWGLLQRRRIEGLGRRWLSLCETPDLDLLPARYRPRRSALFFAGLELAPLHLGLWLLSLAVRWRWVRTLVPLAGLLRRAAELVHFAGSDRGGMVVQARGEDAEGRPILARWTLLAEAGDGPVIPVLPALAALRAIAAGSIAPGARACAGVLPLAAMAAEFRPWRISCREERVLLPPPVFARVLGEAFATLPPAVRALHEPGHALVAMGEAEVLGAEGVLGRLVARLLPFPRPVAAVPLRVVITAGDGVEDWRRRFGAQSFTSHLSPVAPGVVEERFGPLRFRIALQASDAGLDYRVIGWRLGPLPLPRALAPRSPAREWQDEEGRFRFEVPVLLPLLGRVVCYRGWLRVTPPPG